MIMLLPCNDSEKLQLALFESGFLTIPVHAQIEGVRSQCLRITPMATHTESEIKSLAGALTKYKDLIC
jgi:7-keto-8-aminopelargonate synthetase-like enzyme